MRQVVMWMPGWGFAQMLPVSEVPRKDRSACLQCAFFSLDKRCEMFATGGEPDAEYSASHLFCSIPVDGVPHDSFDSLDHNFFVELK